MYKKIIKKNNVEWDPVALVAMLKKSCRRRKKNVLLIKGDTVSTVTRDYFAAGFYERSADLLRFLVGVA